MATVDGGVAAFTVQWFDPSGATRVFILNFYLQDGSVSLFEASTNQFFLKRCLVREKIALEDLHVGNVITIYSRKMKVITVADRRTEKTVLSSRSTTVAIVKPEAMHLLGKLISAVEKEFHLCKAQIVKMPLEVAEEFCSIGMPDVDPVKLSGDRVCVMELLGEDCVERWLKAIPEMEASLGVSNAIHGSASLEQADLELKCLRKHPFQDPAEYKDCSLCIIKPHILKEKMGGDILQVLIDSSIPVTALRFFTLTRSNAEDFLEVYKGVVNEYGSWIGEISSGHCMAVELAGEGAVAQIRELCGPYDPEIGRALKPESIRAKFGISAVKNAIQCTDMPQDGPLESKFFFAVLSKTAGM